MRDRIRTHPVPQPASHRGAGTRTSSSPKQKPWTQSPRTKPLENPHHRVESPATTSQHDGAARAPYPSSTEAMPISTTRFSSPGCIRNASGLLSESVPR